MNKYASDIHTLPYINVYVTIADSENSDKEYLNKGRTNLSSLYDLNINLSFF